MEFTGKFSFIGPAIFKFTKDNKEFCANILEEIEGEMELEKKDIIYMENGREPFFIFTKDDKKYLCATFDIGAKNKMQRLYEVEIIELL